MTQDDRTEKSPRPVAGVQHPVALVAAADATLVLTREGAVWGWGDNLYGQLADGTFITRSEPKPAIGLPPIEALGAGHAHVVAVARDWSLWTWGFGHYGQLGDGLTDRRLSVPRKVQNLRARELALDLSPANALVFGLAEVGWTEAGVVTAQSQRLVIKGLAAGSYTYAALANAMTVGPQTPFRHLFVRGTVRSGGITVGVQVNQQWVFQTNVDSRGPFTVLWDVPAEMSATVVIAHYLPGKNLESEVEIDAWGWLKSRPSGAR